MGHKVPPKANRIAYIEDWVSKWFNIKSATEFVPEEFQIRKHIEKRYGKGAAISKILIQRRGKYMNIIILTARPGIVIGRRGQEIENLQKEIQEMTNNENIQVQVMEIKNPALDAQLMADILAMQIERNINYRRAMKRIIQRIMDAGAKGVKVRVSGRLSGVEVARSEWLSKGRMPLGTFRADIDCGFSEAIIKKGKIGVKVWIFKEEKFTKTAKDLLEEAKIVEKEKIEEVEKEKKPLIEIETSPPEEEISV